jgi:plastocyanin
VRRIALLVAVLAAWTAVPAAAPAARPKCSKRVACKGKVRAVRAGVPGSWPKRATFPGKGPRPVTADPAPGGGTAPRKPPPPPPPPPPPVDDPRFVSVSAYDREEPWLLVPSRTHLLAGTVTVQFNNSHAQDPHDLWLRKSGVTHKFDVVDKEQTASRQLALGAGTWKLWCNIGDHEARGMVASVTVAER